MIAGLSVSIFDDCEEMALPLFEVGVRALHGRASCTLREPSAAAMGSAGLPQLSRAEAHLTLTLRASLFNEANGHW